MSMIIIEGSYAARPHVEEGIHPHDVREDR